MQNNVIYGAFGQTRTPTPAPENTSITRLDENTPVTLSHRIHAQINVLRDLAAIVNDPELPKEIGAPLKLQLAEMERTAHELATRLIRAHTDDQVFLQIQTELSDFSKQLISFEAEVLHKTGAEIELIEPPPPPALAQVRTALGNPSKWVNSPTFWISASVGVAAVGGFFWWLLQKEKPADKEDFSKTVTRVKLRRAMPAR